MAQSIHTSREATHRVYLNGTAANVKLINDFRGVNRFRLISIDPADYLYEEDLKALRRLINAALRENKRYG